MSDAAGGEIYDRPVATVHALPTLGTKRPGIGEPQLGLVNDGGDGGMDGILARLAVLETQVASLDKRMSDFRDDFKSALGVGVAAAVGVATMVVVSFLILSSQMDSARRETQETIRFEIERLIPLDASNAR